MAQYLLLFFVAVLSSVTLADDDTYLLFDVEASFYSEPPTYLAFERIPKGEYHLRIERHLLPIPSGDYRLDHLDFYEPGPGISLPEITPTLRQTSPALYLYPERGSRRSIKFTIEEGYINYLGTLKISRNSASRLEIKFVSQESLLRSVCLTNSDLIANNEIKMVFPAGNNKKYTIDCNRLTNQGNPTDA